MTDENVHSNEHNNTKEGDAPQEKQGVLAFFLEIFKFVLVAVLIVIPVRVYIAQPFIVNGSSMDPSFATGEYLIIDELTYHFEKPERLDVVVFSFPQDRQKFFIKRVIGLPGESVAIAGKNVTITNTEHPLGFVLEEPYLDEKNLRDTTFAVTLENNEYFVMGDNRAASFDSRDWGPLDKKLIVGRAFLRLLPIHTIQLFPGTIKEQT